MPATGTTEERVRAVLTVWAAYVAEHAYAWRMLFRDTGGGPQIAAFRADVHDRARGVLAGMIRALADHEIPARELEPLAELMSMGMANPVLWAMDRPDVTDAVLVDAMARVWTGLLGDERRGRP